MPYDKRHLQIQRLLGLHFLAVEVPDGNVCSSYRTNGSRQQPLSLDAQEPDLFLATLVPVEQL